MGAGAKSSKTMLEAVLDVLDELDPYGLLPGAKDGAPVDEYEPEARKMASHLLRDAVISAEQVEAVWQEWFGDPLSEVVGADRVKDLARHLTDLCA